MSYNKTGFAVSFALAVALATGTASAQDTTFASDAASAQHMQKPSGGYAVVNSDGSVARSYNVKNVSHANTGVYVVTFKQKVEDCAPQATIAGDPDTILPGYIVVADSGKKSIEVSTFATLTLLPADYKFSLTLTCK